MVLGRCQAGIRRVVGADAVGYRVEPNRQGPFSADASGITEVTPLLVISRVSLEHDRCGDGSLEVIRGR